MKIVCISDTHNKENQMNHSIPPCDVLIHSGDICGKSSISGISAFAKWFGSQPATYKIGIAGNHDFDAERQPNLIRDIYLNFGCKYLHHESCEIDGMKIFGSPWTPWFHDWAFNMPRNNYQYAINLWKQIPDDTEILITHGPPRNILDKLEYPNRDGSINVGCQQLLDRVQELNKLKLHVFGHIHESYGTLVKDQTTFANASICNRKYQPINKPIEIIIIKT